MRMRLTVVLTVLLAVLLTAIAVALAAVDTSSGEVDFTMKLTMPTEGDQAGAAMTPSGHVWFSGNKARTEMKMPTPAGVPRAQMPGSIITIVDGDARVAYTLMPDSKTAMKMGLDDPRIEAPSQPRNPRSIMDPENYPEGTKITKLGPRTYKGGKVTAYQISWTENKEEITCLVYVDARELPLYIKTTMKDGTIEMTYSNYKFHKLDASLFKVPKGYQIMDMAKMMQGMPPPPK